MTAASMILKFFDSYKPARDLVRISSCEVVTDQRLFLESTLARIRAHAPGSLLYSTEMYRLQLFYKIVSVTQTKNDLSVTLPMDIGRSISVTCLNCNKGFVPERSTARYCSDGCRVSFNRKRKKHLQLT